MSKDGKSGIMTIKFILNSGYEFTMKCTEFTVKRNGLGGVTGWEASGVSENKPVFMVMEQVAAIIRVMSDEENEQ